MKIKNLIITGTVLSLMFLVGCASTSSNYKIPLPTVNIKADSSVKIVTVGNSSMLHKLKNDIAREFKRNGGKIVDDNSDYWIVIYGTQDMRTDNGADIQHNVIYSKVKNENQYGGEEFITKSNFATAAYAHFISVILYDAKDLTPLVNMDFPFYSSKRVDANKHLVLNSTRQVASSFIKTMKKILVFKKSQ